MKMNTVHIVHLSTYPADDGRIFQKSCKSEVAEGYQVTQIVRGDRDETIAGVAMVALPEPKGRLSRMIGLSWKMYRAAMRQQADIYMFHHPDLMLAGLLLKLAGKKVIYETREFYPDKILSMRWIPARLRPFARAAFARYERVTSVLWDHVVVADRHTAKASFWPSCQRSAELSAAPSGRTRRPQPKRQAYAALRGWIVR